MLVKIVALPLRRTVMITPMKIDEMVVYRHHTMLAAQLKSSRVD